MNTQTNTVKPLDNLMPKDNLSQRYSLINTRGLIDVAESKGFKVASVQYPRGKNAQYSQHVVKLDLPGYEANTVGEYRPQIVLKNSHDGSSRICIMGGVFRLICANGLVAGNSFLNIRLRHVGLKQESIEEALEVAAERVTQLVPLVATFKRVTLDDAAKHDFAVKALELRAKVHGMSENEAFMFKNAMANKVLDTRRSADQGNGLWEVLNRVQENTVKASGLFFKGDDGNYHNLRAVTAIRPNLILNQGLWELAESFAEVA